MLPQPTSLDLFPSSAFLFVLCIQCLKFLTPALEQTRALIWTHERPVCVRLDSLHEQVRDPERIKEVPRTILLRAIVLAQLQELVNVRVPRLQVNGEGSLSLAASLVDIAGRVIVDFEHGHESVRVAVRTCDIRVLSSDAVHSEANATRVLANQGRLLQCVVDALDGILSHGQQEAGAHLGLSSARVEQRGRRVREPLLTHQIIRLESCL